MIFIVSTSQDGPDPVTRRIIRSHAMLGRNTRADRRRRVWERGNNGATSTHVPGSDNPISTSKLDLGRPSEVDIFCSETSHMDDRHVLASSIQGKIAPELSLARYDFEMKPYMIRLLQQGQSSHSVPFLPPSSSHHLSFALLVPACISPFIAVPRNYLITLFEADTSSIDYFQTLHLRC